MPVTVKDGSLLVADLLEVFPALHDVDIGYESLLEMQKVMFER